MNTETNVIPIDRYTLVPQQLPAELPPITRVEAQRISNLLVRRFYPNRTTGYTGKIRRCWLSSVPTAATNHSKGLGRLIHDFSHRTFRRVYPHKRPHDPLHVRYEADIAAFVAGSAWLKRVMTPKPAKAKPSTNEKRARELLKTEAAIARWESKQRRARTALKKLAAKKRRLVRALSSVSNLSAVE
jgi:hypothetical protein